MKLNGDDDHLITCMSRSSSKHYVLLFCPVGVRISQISHAIMQKRILEEFTVQYFISIWVAGP